jgi:putative ATP-dependent endonuclease of OLD family
MIAKSLYVSGFSCFQAEPTGFRAFKPITVIIGRNNSGKSKLLDLVQLLTKGHRNREHFETSGAITFTDSDLRPVFREGVSGGRLGGSHWVAHGAHLVGVEAKWKATTGSGVEIQIDPRRHHTSTATQQAREDELRNHLRAAEPPFFQKHFRRILADRDINPEQPVNDLSISPSGAGATNVVRRHIVSSTLDEDLIQKRLLTDLDRIFGNDGTFQQIEIRQLDTQDKSSEGDHWEIFLREPGKGLIPLSASGSGLKTVILVLLNLIAIPSIENRPPANYVFAFEELENNLHPALLRRLLDYLTEYVDSTGCYLFLTTHSSVTLDYFGSNADSQIIHVAHDGMHARATTISAHLDRVALIQELGAKPSDLLQANGIIWLEGPSDRIYLNRLLQLYSNGKFREGKDYQCAYYGGSVLARMAFSPEDDIDNEFTNLLRLNNNIAVVCDGDRIASNGAGSRIKERVRRIKQQAEAIPDAYIWITDAKEIENYVPGSVWAKVYNVTGTPDPGPYDSFPTVGADDNHFVNRELNRKSFDKCEFATAASPLLTRELLDFRFEIKAKMLELVARIESWNS